MDNGDRPAECPRAGDLAQGRNAANTGITYAPYWWDTAPRRDGSVGQIPRQTDVVIVGSGYTGLSAALTLLRRGRIAIVLERGFLGYGASTRNGGQVGSGNQKFRVKKLVELRGRAKAIELLREGTRMLDSIAEFIACERINCHFMRCGRFRGATRPGHYEAMARDMEDLRDVAGVESFMVPRTEQHKEIGSDVFFGGSVLPHDASLHPGLYHAGLMQRVEDAGGTVFGESGATSITRQGQGFAVTTVRETITCRDVIIATNGYTDGLVPELRQLIVPVGSGMIATGVIPSELYEKLLPQQRVYGNTNRVFSYFRGAPGERRIIWGGRVARFGSADTPRAYAHLARDMLHVFPDLKDVPITHAWDGLIGYTHDEVPHLGRTMDGLYFAVGYCGTGVSRATYFGNKIALKLLGDPEGRTAFDDLPFERFPAHAITKRMVPVVETWFSLRDKFRF